MERLKMETPNIANENFQKLAEMFPNAVTEAFDENGKLVRAIDKDVLMQEISCEVVDGKTQRYRFQWPDKNKAILTANTQTQATLRPCREESVNFDNTQNLYIEGDNLEVLKVLRNSYKHKIKMIYIDPPYNTGHDFVYDDNFATSVEEHLLNSGQVDSEGNKLRANLESNGRFHTDWLNFIYPRLKIARDLLTDDGVILLSIDDNEIDNLTKICNEIFGESNFMTSIVWQKKTGASDAKGIATITENILVICKNASLYQSIFTKNTSSYDLNRYRYTDEYVEERGPYYIDNLDRGGLSYSDSLNYGIECPDGTITYPNGRTTYVNDGWIWKWSKEKIEWARKNKFIEFRKTDKKASGWSVCYKNYLKVDNENNPIERAAPHKNLINDVLNANAAAIMKELFGTNNYFNYSKPIELIKKLVSFVQTDNSVILDFFSGSATTAHAVMQLNAEDGGNRKYIMVQLPEKTDEKSEAFKAGYPNICEIGKERIRRAAKKIKEETNADIDYGFKVLKLSDSNMKKVFYTPEETQQTFFDDLTENIKEDRTSEDLLFQVMLELGLELSYPISKTEICGKEVFNINIGDEEYLYACFDKGITDEVVKSIAERRPYYAVFRDSGMQSDDTFENFEQIFKKLSPDTIRKVL